MCNDLLSSHCIINHHQILLPKVYAAAVLQVRYHPLHSDILASGSLDQEVRLWDANTAYCIGSQDFSK
jgi:WD40 repeat protein